jgi:phosphoglycerate dehydrogenase-like enzyme
MSKTVVAALECSEEMKQIIETPLASLAEVVYLQEVKPEARTALLKGADAVMVYKLGQELSQPERGMIKESAMLQSVTAGAEHIPYGDFTPGLTVCSNAGAWAEPLAEWTLGMVIALAKEFRKQRSIMAGGQWQRSYTYVLKGRTLGIIGYGGIGQAVKRMMSPLEMKVMALTRSGQTGAEVDYEGSLDQLDELLAESDVVVISIPLTNQTRGLIGKERLAKMKHNAILINLARGAIVDQAALYEHMSGHPEFKFASDVWWDEPKKDQEYKLDYPLFELPNVMGTPHNADHVQGSLEEAAAVMTQNVVKFLKGEPLHGQIKREDYK